MFSASYGCVWQWRSMKFALWKEPKVVCVTELSVDPWDPCQGCLKGPSKRAWITSTRGKILPDSGLWVWAFLRVNEDPLIQDRKRIIRYQDWKIISVVGWKYLDDLQFLFLPWPGPASSHCLGARFRTSGLLHSLSNTMAQGGQKVQDVYFNISFDQSYSKSFRKPKYIIKMVVKTPLSSTDPI